MPAVPAPAVVMWFRIYAAAMALLYLFCTIAGIALFFIPPDWLDSERDEMLFMGTIFAIMGFPFFAVFAAGIFLPRRPWVWIYDLVLIAVGFGSCCILPASVALLIFWIKPETRAYFGRT
jgi:hypothetical protein